MLDDLLLFRRDTSAVLVAWTITESHIQLFPHVTGSIESIGMFGEKQTLQPD